MMKQIVAAMLGVSASLVILGVGFALQSLVVAWTIIPNANSIEVATLKSVIDQSLGYELLGRVFMLSGVGTFVASMIILWRQSCV